MSIRVLTSILHAVELSAWTMISAGERAVFAPTDSGVRFWTVISCAGEALEAFVDRISSRLGVDMSEYMIDRAYADAGR